MAKQKGITGDYKMLDGMSKELVKHGQKLKALGKKIAGNKVSIDIKEGLVENLEIVSNHMGKAQKELDKAKKRLKMI